MPLKDSGCHMGVPQSVKTICGWLWYGIYYENRSYQAKYTKYPLDIFQVQYLTQQSREIH